MFSYIAPVDIFCSTKQKTGISQRRKDRQDCYKTYILFASLRLGEINQYDSLRFKVFKEGRHVI